MSTFLSSAATPIKNSGGNLPYIISVVVFLVVFLTIMFFRIYKNQDEDADDKFE